MIKVIKYLFTLGTTYVGSTVKEEVEIEFDEDASQDEIYEEVKRQYEQWVWDNNYGGWDKISETVKED